VASRSGHVDGAHVTVMLVVAIAAKVFVAFPRFLTLAAGSAGWLALAAGALIALAALALGLAAMGRFRGESMVPVCIRLAGPVLGRLLTLPVWLGFLFVTALTARQFAESFSTALLPRTPVPVISATIVVLAGLSAAAGLETLVRATMLFSLVLAFFLVALLAGTLPLADLTNLWPLLGPGLGPVALEGWKASGFYGEFFLLFLIVDAFRRRSELWRTGALAIGVGWLILSAISVLTVAVFSVPGAERLSFPIFMLARSLNIGEFVERVEALFVFLWMLTAVLKLGATLFAAVIMLAQYAGLAHFRPLVPGTGLLVYLLAAVPRSGGEAATLDFRGLREWGWTVVVGVPLVMYLLGLRRRGKEQTG